MLDGEGRGGIQAAPTANICVTVNGKVVVGRRPRHRAGVHRRHPQATRPEQPSLPSVGGGMAAGAAFAYPRAADARVRPIFCAICNVNVQMTHKTSPHTSWMHVR